jgi:large subunit ribosomal protein L10
VSTAAKRAVVEQVKKGYSSSEMIFFVDFKGVPVAAERSLRVDLRTKSASMRVAKARLIKIALRDLGAVEVNPILEQLVGGQVALIFSEKDSQFVAKSLVDFQRKTGRDVFVTGGLYQKSLYDNPKIFDLARFPAKQVLIQRLAFAISSPLVCLARAIKEVAEKIK